MSSGYDPRVSRLWKLLRSPRLALGVLAFLAVYGGLAAWYPWQRPGGPRVPAWALALHLDRPFSSPVFLGAALLLFLSTAACTWDRTLRVAALFRGRVRPYGFQLPVRAGIDAAAFLAAQGFSRPRSGGACFRARAALWGGWVLHLGLLSLMAGVVAQQGWHDGGAFEIAEGESVRLAAPGTVFGRDRGAFAPSAPPDLAIGLLAFDPFLHQRGYAPDRASRIRVEPPGTAPIERALDRAAGVEVAGVTLFQAIPSGLAVVVESPQLGARALHLRDESDHRAHGTFNSPSGLPVVFGVDSDRSLHDPAGTGALAVWIEREGRRSPLAAGVPFDFGGEPARFVTVVRWGGFTYSINPGMPAVFAGFTLVLLGAALLTLPAGAAEIAATGVEPAAWVYLTRGREALVADWANATPPPSHTATEESS